MATTICSIVQHTNKAHVMSCPKFKVLYFLSVHLKLTLVSLLKLDIIQQLFFSSSKIKHMSTSASKWVFIYFILYILTCTIFVTKITHTNWKANKATTKRLVDRVWDLLAQHSHIYPQPHSNVSQYQIHVSSYPQTETQQLYFYFIFPKLI